MNIVPAGPAVLAGIALFFLPGLVFLALMRQEDRLRVPWDEALFLAVAASVAAASWVGLALAEAGRFSLPGAGAILGLGSLLAAGLGRRRLTWPLPPIGRLTQTLPAFSVLILALALQARPSEHIVGGRDPGVYVATMALIGRTGGISHTDPAVLAIPREDVTLFFRNPQNPDFSWGRFSGIPLERPETGRVFPEFFHLFPAFGAYLFQALGVKGALATSSLFGVLGTLSVFFAFRRIFGPAPALLGSLLLAGNVVQVWFARYPISEPLSQFLMFLGILAFSHWEERGSPAFGVLAGVALGLSLLVRIDSVLIIVSIGLYLLVRRAHRDLPLRVAAPLLVPLAFLVAHAVFHAAFWSRKYVLNIATRPYWNHPASVWGALAAGIVVLAWAVHRWGPALVEALEAHHDALRAAAIVGIVLLALYAYFLRPQLSAWAGADGNNKALALANPALLRALGFHHLAAHDAQSFFRLGWFVTPLGLFLAVAGLLLAFREWKPRYLFPVLTTLVFSAFYFYKLRVWNDYFFSLRRFVPVVLPSVMGFSALLLCRMARRGGIRRAVTISLSLTLVALYARDTRRIASHVDWKHAIRFVADLSRRFGPEDIVVFEQQGSIHLLSLPLWAIHGVSVLELARYDPERECPDCLGHLVSNWRHRYRNIYFVHTYRSRLCGLFLERVPAADYRFATREWERTYDRPPRRPVTHGLRFTISRVVLPEELAVPPLTEVDIGGTDDVLLSGFFDKEGGGERTYRWTGPCASVYLPGAQAGAEVVLTASTEQRPQEKPAVLRVSLSGVSLGQVTVGPTWVDHAFRLPDPLPPGPPLLRLEVPGWRPANVIPGSDDTRDLGIMLDRIHLRRHEGD